MKIKSIVLATAVLGGLLSSTAFATTTAAHAQATAALKFDAPVPARVVAPTGLPHGTEGSTVTLSMTIDAAGQAHNIRLISGGDDRLAKSLVSAVKQWQFTPARKNGTAVPAKVTLPLKLVDSENS